MTGVNITARPPHILPDSTIFFMIRKHTRRLRKALSLNFFIPERSQQEAKKQANLPPGTMVYIGQEREGAPRLSAWSFTPDTLEEEVGDSLDSIMEHVNNPMVTWVNIDGIHDIDLVNEITRRFRLHPLTREDIVNTTQIPKIEGYEDYLYLTLKMFSVEESTGKIDIEQVNLVLGPTYVMSLQEKTEDVFEPIRSRIRQAKGQVRKQQSDYLFYALIDIIVSNYLIVINHLARKIDELEAEITDEPRQDHLNDIAMYKKTVLYLRRFITPLKEEILILRRDLHPLIHEGTYPYFNDLLDLLGQCLSELDTYRDTLKNLSDQYLAMASHKMNEVMKVLTMVSTVFIPLSFLAGLYGMNFDHMPELHYEAGYPILLYVMGAITIGMLVYFRVKRWF